MKQAVDALGSLLVLSVLLEAALAFPGNLTIEASSAEAGTARVTNVDLQGKLISDATVPADPQRKGRSEEPLQPDLQEEAWSKEHPRDGRQERGRSEDASFFGRLLDAIKSFREGYSLRDTMKKSVKVVFVYKQPFDN
jgi:hypothetical protein